MEIYNDINKDIDECEAANFIDDSDNIELYLKKSTSVIDEDMVLLGGAKPSESSVREYEVEKPQEFDKKLTTEMLNVISIARNISKGPAGDHIRSMNTFYKAGIEQIVTKIFKAEFKMRNERDKTKEDQDIEFLECTVEFTSTNLEPPNTLKPRSQTSQMLTPNAARLNNQSYMASLYVTFKVTARATLKNGQVRERIEETPTKVRIGAVPIMVKSELCNLHMQTHETLKALEEDPLDSGGYFIIAGKEWAVDITENLTPNKFHVYKNAHEREIARGTFQSKPGDAYENSYYLILRYLHDGQITVEIRTNKFDKFEIPWYLLFRLFGITRDRDMFNHVVYGVENVNPVTVRLINILKKSHDAKNSTFGEIQNSVNSNDIAEFLSMKLTDLASNANLKKDENAMKYVNSITYGMLDKFIFPHIGSTPASRIRKLRFLGHLINKLLYVEAGSLESTDRDSYENKRLHAAGVSFGKSVKTQLNFGVIQPIKKGLMDAFRNTQFSQIKLVDTVKAAIGPEDLAKGLTKSIVTGDKTITVRKTEMVNRISSQQLTRRNSSDTQSTLNNISTHGQSAAKANERAREMRSVQPSGLDFIGPAHSNESGEKVGMNKQLTIITSITESSSSYELKRYIGKDPDFIPLDDVIESDIRKLGLTKIFVNGDWIGFCKKSHEFAKKYRNARRYGDIDIYTTIEWSLMMMEIYFWVDVGRLTIPAIIVYNNEDQYEPKDRAANFKQWTKLTFEHIRGLQEKKITIEDLRRERVIEFLSPEEMSNMYFARTYDDLVREQNNILHAYTHVNIEINIFGIIELSAPNTNHSTASRITMFTNHKKQTAGWYANNWPFRVDKNTIFQIYCQMPMVRAPANILLLPNAANVILAYMPAAYNQEDSLILNKCSIDRGLFNALRFYFESTERDKDEIFGIPDISRTLEIKKNANYSYLDDNGFIRTGTIVRNGYVLVGKMAKLQKPVQQFVFTDRSIVYLKEEEAIVERVITSKNDDGAQVIKVKLRSFRPIIVGDKLSSHSGCKGICAIQLNQADMPYTETGIVPDVIINAHSIPTRMVIGQIIETLMATLATKRGALDDGTPFRTLDIDSMMEELDTKYGVKYGGKQRMYNGRSGMWMDSFIFIGPTSYQRLQKFVKDESYAMSSGPTSALTRQPLDGKSNQGGLKIGEMEKDVICAHGSMRTLFSKFYTDSDGIEMYVCRICKNRAYINNKNGIYKCKYCGDAADIVAVKSSWAANIFLHEMNSMGIKMKLTPKPFTYSRNE